MVSEIYFPPNDLRNLSGLGLGAWKVNIGPGEDNFAGCAGPSPGYGTKRQ